MAASQPRAKAGAAGSKKLADARPVILYHGVAVGIFDQGYHCRIPIENVAIDADGAPNAYGPAKSKREGRLRVGLAYLGRLPDLQGRRDRRRLARHPCAGPCRPDETISENLRLLHFEAATSDAVPGKYVDASAVSYLVMPQLWFDRFGMQLGDLCLLWHSRIKTKAVAVVADTCPVDEPLGEVSIAAAQALGGKNVSPRDGVKFPRPGAICCVMFMNSRPQLQWLLSDTFVQSFKEALVTRLGNLPVL